MLLVDTATEEGLPHYAAEISSGFPVWDEWNGRWIAEERSHGDIMVRDIEARGILDMSSEWLPVREQNLATGIHPNITSPADGLAYVATQELLTKVAHFNSARIMDTPGAKNLWAIGGDENRHYNFYVSALQALGRVAPDAALAGMRRQHKGNAFNMPGKKGIPGFSELSLTIILGGLFDKVTVLEAQRKTIDDAKLLEAAPVTDQGKIDQEWAHGIYSRQDPIWVRKQNLMDGLRERAKPKQEAGVLLPFILGQTVEIIEKSYVPIAS